MTASNSLYSSFLRNSLDHQDQRFEGAFSILREAIAARAFPAASTAVTHAGELVAWKALGHFTFEPQTDRADAGTVAPYLSRPFPQGDDLNPAVQPTTLFDLASLTKIVATTAMAMLLYERGLLDLDAPVAAIVPEFLGDAAKDSRRRDVTLRQLLAHSSGLPAYEKLFLTANTRDDLLQAAFTTALTADPGSRTEYSDIGFIILGVALEQLADESLDSFCRREIFAPLAMANTTFRPPAHLRADIAPTQDDKTFRHRIIQGEVQDENAFLLGGVAGHAGLFSTARDLAQFAQGMLSRRSEAPADEDDHFGQAEGGVPHVSRLLRESILRAETISLFTRRECSPAGTSRALGWDTPSASSQSGKYFSEPSFGHLGYTGTSLWIDPQRQLSITLLTNRTWPDCSNHAIKQIRPSFHNAVLEAII